MVQGYSVASYKGLLSMICMLNREESQTPNPESETLDPEQLSF